MSKNKIFNFIIILLLIVIAITIIMIIIKYGRNQVNEVCTGSTADFDQYKIDISVTGKMTIDADITNSRAADFVTINTSLRDSI